MARRRRGTTNKEKAFFVYKHRYLIVKRASGLHRKADVIAALGSVVEPAAPGTRGASAPAGGE